MKSAKFLQHITYLEFTSQKTVSASFYLFKYSEILVTMDVQDTHFPQKKKVYVACILLKPYD